MAGNRREPAFRDFDIYHEVVVCGSKQKVVAQSFGVQPSRISQVVRRVRAWVGDSVGSWLFPGRHELRFLAALDHCQIRLSEGAKAQFVMIEHTGGCHRYTRTNTVIRAQVGANLSPQARKLAPADEGIAAAVTPDASVTSILNAGARGGREDGKV